MTLVATHLRTEGFSILSVTSSSSSSATSLRNLSSSAYLCQPHMSALLQYSWRYQHTQSRCFTQARNGKEG